VNGRTASTDDVNFGSSLKHSDCPHAITAKQKGGKNK
jgi:hypothetical protein